MKEKYPSFGTQGRRYPKSKDGTTAFPFHNGPRLGTTTVAGKHPAPPNCMKCLSYFGKDPDKFSLQVEHFITPILNCNDYLSLKFFTVYIAVSF